MAIEGMRQQDVPSTLLGSDFFALSLGLDMLDVGGFVVAAAMVVVEMTSAGVCRRSSSYGGTAQQPFLTSPKKSFSGASTAQHSRTGREEFGF